MKNLIFSDVILNNYNLSKEYDSLIDANAVWSSKDGWRLEGVDTDKDGNGLPQVNLYIHSHAPIRLLSFTKDFMNDTDEVKRYNTTFYQLNEGPQEVKDAVKECYERALKEEETINGSQNPNLIAQLFEELLYAKVHNILIPKYEAEVSDEVLGIALDQFESHEALGPKFLNVLRNHWNNMHIGGEDFVDLGDEIIDTLNEGGSPRRIIKRITERNIHPLVITSMISKIYHIELCRADIEIVVSAEKAPDNKEHVVNLDLNFTDCFVLAGEAMASQMQAFASRELKIQNGLLNYLEDMGGTDTGIYKFFNRLMDEAGYELSQYRELVSNINWHVDKMINANIDTIRDCLLNSKNTPIKLKKWYNLYISEFEEAGEQERLDRVFVLHMSRSLLEPIRRKIMTDARTLKMMKKVTDETRYVGLGDVYQILEEFEDDIQAQMDDLNPDVMIVDYISLLKGNMTSEAYNQKHFSMAV